MAYTPPHRRHSGDAVKPPPLPEPLVPQFGNKLNLHSATTSRGKKGKRPPDFAEKIVYSRDCVSRWWPVGSPEDDPIPESFRLEPTSNAFFDQERGEKPLVLVDANPPAEGCDVMEGPQTTPWVIIAERVLPDLISALQTLKIELESRAGEFTTSLVVRVGKIFFLGGSSTSLEMLRRAAWSRPRKTFYTNVPCEYFEEIGEAVVPKIGFYFHKEKDQYYVKINDKNQPKTTITCKCIATKDLGKLEMYKIQSNLERHVVEDISCLYKDLDLRIILYKKETLVDIEDEDKDAIRRLVEEATLDAGVKGGLRWPLGKNSAGERFTVVGAWHTKHRKFKSKDPDISLYLRCADRFDFVSSIGGISNEVTLKMHQASGWVKDGTLDADSISKTLKEAVKLTWENLLNCSHPLAS